MPGVLHKGKSKRRLTANPKKGRAGEVPGQVQTLELQHHHRPLGQLFNLNGHQKRIRSRRYNLNTRGNQTEPHLRNGRLHRETINPSPKEASRKASLRHPKSPRHGESLFLQRGTTNPFPSNQRYKLETRSPRKLGPFQRHEREKNRERGHPAKTGLFSDVSEVQKYKPSKK